ncbi:major facilitator superfamily MFS_1 [Paludibacter propionicigenes WB4]|uniref:Major facilitator superfamily MFS_1 n=1 Tax=Paludibacter propionicigenes (strain DSM 17365 / JCM 13257 / WB4) TaxID=694427 RepID=E4T6B7_PALPW|nr:MFS transporter [Paludibacter propionicigenes]ADQ80261.1 major facilitator superfamily MFS_1 [Paludibacter propionicigenes WB4]
MFIRLFGSEAFTAVRNYNFRYFLGYRFLMTMATMMQSVIVSWHMYFLTKNVIWLGLIGLVEVFPQISISLFAGHYVDLWNRKKIVRYTTLLLLAGSAILTLYSIESFHSYQHLGIWPMFITIFLTGLSRGILMPANTALLGQLVDKKDYANAATWSSANWQVAAVMGPALGGLIYGFSSISVAYGSVFILFMFSLWMISRVEVAGRIVSDKVSEEDIFSRIREGIGFVMKSPQLLGAFSLDMFAVLFGGAVAMLPVFASDILHVGPQGLGFLRACPALGAIFMSFYLMFNPPVKNSGRTLLLAVSAFGLCMIGFAFSHWFWLSALLLLLSGLFDNVSVVIRGTILQLYTPEHMRGRVASVNSIFIGSSNELGAFESGMAAKLMGLVPSVAFGGIMTLIVVATTAKVNPVLRKLSLK